jgi:hypothetical protein
MTLQTCNICCVSSSPSTLPLFSPPHTHTLAALPAEAPSADEFSGDAYVDIGDIKDATTIYKVGDMVSCFVLGVDEENSSKIELTQFLDEEIDGDEEVAIVTGEVSADQVGAGAGRRQWACTLNALPHSSVCKDHTQYLCGTGVSCAVIA